jgi:hypothetical protein
MKENGSILLVIFVAFIYVFVFGFLLGNAPDRNRNYYLVQLPDRFYYILQYDECRVYNNGGLFVVCRNGETDVWNGSVLSFEKIKQEK